MCQTSIIAYNYAKAERHPRGIIIDTWYQFPTGYLCSIDWQSRRLQCESKNSPYGFLKFFPKRLGIFNQFYTPITRSFLH